MLSRLHIEGHRLSRAGWLRAAVLGANDGIVSTASLILGVAAASGGKAEVLVAGVAGLVAGAMSMAAGEYVSVNSQSDAEHADLARERAELREQPEFELQELTDIYTARGLSPELARKVAQELTAKNALEAHARDELGITEFAKARPIQAALASAASFAVGAALPLLTVTFAPLAVLGLWVGLSSLVFLALLGWAGARAGGAKPMRPVIRVVFWGAFAMVLTAAIGSVLGVAV